MVIIAVIITIPFFGDLSIEMKKQMIELDCWFTNAFPIILKVHRSSLRPVRSISFAHP
jgi:hypothetical protein